MQDVTNLEKFFALTAGTLCGGTLFFKLGTKAIDMYASGDPRYIAAGVLSFACGVGSYLGVRLVTKGYSKE